MTFNSVGKPVTNGINRSAIGFFQCAGCHSGIVVEFEANQALEPWYMGQQTSKFVKVLDSYPRIQDASAPEFTPPNVENFYLQGCRARDRQDYDAAGTMFRKALDISLKVLHPDGKGNLKRRIEILPVETGITSAMKEWAHVIRDEGNDAAHEAEPYTEEDAKALALFTETFLTCTFTLPGMIIQRRKQTEITEPMAE